MHSSETGIALAARNVGDMNPTRYLYVGAAVFVVALLVGADVTVPTASRGRRATVVDQDLFPPL